MAKDVVEKGDNSLSIHHKIRNAIVNHCKNEFPLEACGLFSGKDGIVTSFWPMKNEDYSPVSYSMNKKETSRVFEMIEEQEEEVMGIYHSHPTAAAYPSQGDISLNNYPELVHLIVSLLGPLPEVKAYQLNGLRIQPIRINLR